MLLLPINVCKKEYPGNEMFRNREEMKNTTNNRFQCSKVKQKEEKMSIVFFHIQ